MNSQKDVNNCAFYREVCLLRLLAKMGYLDQHGFESILHIALEDYGATLVLDKSLLCLN